jgi:gamma-glutamylcyclotransferase (GGCT)/AIG2-like uncharacterized protein YtfP
MGKTTKPEHLFVYGTLRRGFTNAAARKLHRESAFAGEAHVKGKLLPVHPEYPGFLVDSAGDDVNGELFHLEEPLELLAYLDAYEGHEFERRTVEARLADGKKLPVWIYCYVAATGG